jgi:hypothetical protein
MSLHRRPARGIPKRSGRAAQSQSRRVGRRNGAARSWKQDKRPTPMAQAKPARARPDNACRDDPAESATPSPDSLRTHPPYSPAVREGRCAVAERHVLRGKKRQQARFVHSIRAGQYYLDPQTRRNRSSRSKQTPVRHFPCKWLGPSPAQVACQHRSVENRGQVAQCQWPL